VHGLYTVTLFRQRHASRWDVTSTQCALIVRSPYLCAVVICRHVVRSAGKTNWTTHDVQDHDCFVTPWGRFQALLLHNSLIATKNVEPAKLTEAAAFTNQYEVNLDHFNTQKAIFTREQRGSETAQGAPNLTAIHLRGSGKVPAPASGPQNGRGR
jgi:hypothetical protein